MQHSSVSDHWFQEGDVLPAAFAQRQALMPMWGAVPATGSLDDLWQQALTAPVQEGALAYIHVPFCANRCVFCGFYRNAWKEAQGPAYVDRVIAELRDDAGRRPAGGSIAALYLGGGTPTALQARDLSRLLRAARDYLPLADDCEITVEGRISHFDDEKIEACLAAGANRFSIGIQTFDNALRRRLGRQHDGDEAARYMRRLAEYDAVVVADLIFGLPGQDDALWAHDMDVALSLQLDGLDVYAFNCYPSLPINRMIEKGALPPVPELATLARHYAYAVRRLLAEGWAQLSNSHFGRPGGGERNRYNNAIKSGRDCLAFGSGSGGCQAGLSYHVEGDLGAYLATPPGRKPLGMAGRVSPNRDLLAPLQGGLEQGELPLAPLAGNAAAQALVNEWEACGLLRREAGLARLSLGGRFWAPTMTRAIALTLEPYPEMMMGGGRPAHGAAAPRHPGHGHPASAGHPMHPTQAAAGHPAHAMPVHSFNPTPMNSQGERKMAQLVLDESQRQALQERLAANPGVVLEQLAEAQQCSLVAVVECLPRDMWWRCDGSRFVELLQAIAAWRTSVTVIVHTADVIMEFLGPLPAGSLGHGFYNLDGGADGLHGHLRHAQCASIHLIERPFMGKQSACLLFANQQGQAMFKVFAGRDETGALRAEQVQSMRALVAGEAVPA